MQINERKVYRSYLHTVRSSAYRYFHRFAGSNRFRRAGNKNGGAVLLPAFVLALSCRNHARSGKDDRSHGGHAYLRVYYKDNLYYGNDACHSRHYRGYLLGVSDNMVPELCMFHNLLFQSGLDAQF